jgi:hypothetical protein
MTSCLTETQSIDDHYPLSPTRLVVGFELLLIGSFELENDEPGHAVDGKVADNFVSVS